MQVPDYENKVPEAVRESHAEKVILFKKRKLFIYLILSNWIAAYSLLFVNVSDCNKSFLPKKFLIKCGKKHEKSTFNVGCVVSIKIYGFYANGLVVVQCLWPKNLVAVSPKTDHPHFGHPVQS